MATYLGNINPKKITPSQWKYIKAKIEELEEKLYKARMQKIGYRQSWSDAENKYATLEEENTALKKKISMLKAKLSKTQAQKKREAQDCDELEEKCTTLEKEKTELRELVDTLEVQIASLGEQYACLEAETTVLKVKHEEQLENAKVFTVEDAMKIAEHNDKRENKIIELLQLKAHLEQINAVTLQELQEERETTKTLMTIIDSKDQGLVSNTSDYDDELVRRFIIEYRKRKDNVIKDSILENTALQIENAEQRLAIDRLQKIIAAYEDECGWVSDEDES